MSEYLTIDGHRYPIEPDQSVITVDGTTYVEGANGQFSPIPGGLTAQQFTVALGALRDAHADLVTAAAEIQDDLAAIASHFAAVEAAWRSPSASSFQGVQDWFTRSSRELHELFVEAGRRLHDAYETYLDAEAHNFSNLSGT